MYQTIKKAGLLATLGVAVAGCSSINLNEGASTHTYLPNSATEKPHQIYFSPAEQKQAEQHKLLIKKDQNISVTLSAIYICDFRESGFLSGDYFDTSNADSEACPVKENRRRAAAGKKSNYRAQKAATRGELAVLANIQESQSFVGVKRDEQRVVFYSDDVRETGQPLNFFNKTLYGPVKYDGGYLDIAFSIVELDEEENKNFKAVLDSLAGVGAKAYPPSSVALEVINGIGKSVLDNNKDDVMLSYTLRFDPPNTGNVSTIERAPLQEGFYAVLRNENRNDAPAWDAVCLNRRNGTLVHCDRKNKPTDELYREKTWMVFRISRESEAASKTNNQFETLEQFRKMQEVTNYSTLPSAINALTTQLNDINAKAASEAGRAAASPTSPLTVEPLETKN